MLVFDAYRAFNSSNSGLMTCSELYGGLHFLGIPFSPDQIYDLVRKLALHNEGLVSYVEFKKVFKKHDEDLESRLAEGGNNNFGEISPKIIPEISDAYRKDDIEEAVVLSGKILSQFKVKVNPVGSFEAIWTSENTNSKTQASLWGPSLDVTMLHSNKTRICLGHYANKGIRTTSFVSG
jgi:hypothetical protein